MEPLSSGSFSPAQAGAFLIVVTLAVMGAGTLIGWLAGSTRIGLIVGAIVGVPAGVAAVFARYRRAFS